MSSEATTHDDRAVAAERTIDRFVHACELVRSTTSGEEAIRPIYRA